MLAWTYLFLAGLLEVCWAIGLKYAEGFTKLTPSFFTIITMVGSVILLAKAVQLLPIGTAYAIWVGIGACGTAIMGIILFQEPASIIRVSFLILLIFSIAGLKYTS
ncbi:MAG: hypothetical protein LCH30_07700 [Proteobacteria bacterium]|nr:hypothetical protein [Pseudomonadota bacterium]